MSLRLSQTLVFAALLAMNAVKATTLPPPVLNYQGRVAVGGTNFDGTGQFKFALVNAAGTTTFWSNDGTSSAGSPPTAAVALPVTKGLYAVLLGDPTLTNMTSVPAAVFANSDVRLRVWFNDGTNGFQLLTPDQRVAAAGYAMMAGTASSVPDGAITSAKLAAGSVGTTQLAPGAQAPPLVAAATGQTATANSSYVTTGTLPTTIALPPTPNVGDVVQVTGAGAGGWIVQGSIQATEQPSVWNPQPAAGIRNWWQVTSSADGQKLAAVVDGGLIYTSADTGATWTARQSSRSWQAIASSADGSKLVAVVAGDFIYTSTDSGATWTPRDTVRQWSSVASSADGTKLVAGANNGKLYTSTDSGVTWTPRESIRNWTSVASTPDGSKLIAVASSSQIYTSTDSGVTWTPRESGRNWTCAAISANGARMAAVVDGEQVYTSADGGVTWTPHLSNLSWSSVTMSADGRLLVALSLGSQIYSSNDYGLTWTTHEASRSWISAAASSDGLKLVALDTGGLIYTCTATGQLAGAQGTTASLQYLGNGAWAPVAQSQIAAGVVGSAQLAAGAVGSAQLAGSLTLTGNAIVGSSAGTLPAVLRVGGSVTNTNLTYGYLNGNGTVGRFGPGSLSVSLSASDRIVAQEFDALSDARLKRVAGISDAVSDLQTLRAIEITDYTFRDPVAKGDGAQKKVIAQQVERVFPQAVSRSVGVVPDILCVAAFRDGWTELATDLKVGERVRLLAEGEEGIYEVLELRPGAFRTAFAPSATRVFVYGREVSDLRAVDYEAIAMLNVSATQEVARQLAGLAGENAALREKNAQIEGRLARLEKALVPALVERKRPRQVTRIALSR